MTFVSGPNFLSTMHIASRHLKPGEGPISLIIRPLIIRGLLRNRENRWIVGSTSHAMAQHYFLEREIIVKEKDNA